MSIQDHKSLTWRAYNAEFNQRDMAASRECYSADYRCHFPLFPEPIGRDTLEEQAKIFTKAFPDIRVAFEDAFGEDDRLVVRHVLTGTHQGEYLGIAATGKQVTITGTDIYRFADGKIVEEWAQPNLFGLLQQLGAIPTPGA